MSTPYLASAAQIALPSQRSASVSDKAFDGNPESSLQPVATRQSHYEQIFVDLMLRAWNGVRKVLKAQQTARKHLRVCETAPLGDKRFVAVIQVGQERFLIGGAANSIAMLARLSEPVSFPSLDAREYSERPQER